MQHIKSHTYPSPDLLNRFEKLVGSRHTLRDPEQMQPFLTEWRGKFHGRSSLILSPGSVEEISAIMKLASETHVAIVPQGGNTGLVGGQIPSIHGNEIVVSMSRLDKILNIDTENDTLTVQAGCTLASIQKAASSVNRMFPLRLGPDGDSQIGGNLSTNAGGANAIAYGVTRDLTLGLQVVLADGRIWDGLRNLRKDNTGYDLKQIFIGAEGTLGIITAAILKIFSRPQTVETVYVALPNPTAAITLLHTVRNSFGRSITSFELIPDIGIRFGLRHITGASFPFTDPSSWYVLMDITSEEKSSYLRTRIDTMLNDIIAKKLAHDVACAQSNDQAQTFWQLRAGLSQAQKHEGGSIKHDISLPLGSIPQFLDEAAIQVEQLIPGARPVPFGHLGDGNLHYNVSQPIGDDTTAFLDRWKELNAMIHSLVHHYNGSISAEHGIGQLKRDILPKMKSDVEMELMQRLKKALDPNIILNPGKLIV